MKKSFPTSAAGTVPRNAVAVALGMSVFLCALAVAPAAHAAGTHAVAVGAVVLSKSTCRFDTAGPTALSFGTIDPSSATDKTATATIGFRCSGSAGTAVYNITSDDGLYETGPGAPRMRHATNLAQHLKYSVNLPQSGSVPKNTNQAITVTGTVAVADFQNAMAGTYADTVVLSIAP